MSYTNTVIVTDGSPAGKRLPGAVITDDNDGHVVGQTDSSGQLTINDIGGDENLAVAIEVSLPNYGPEPAELASNLTTVVVPLEPLPISTTDSTNQKPGAPSLKPQPATITQDNSILVSWTSPQSYDKYLIWWTYVGAPQGAHFDQGEVDNGGTTGSWTATPTTPGFTYTFAIDGGVRSLYVLWAYSGFGPTASAQAIPNLTSLRAYLQVSGLNFPQQMRSLMSPQTSMRKFMKLA